MAFLSSNRSVLWLAAALAPMIVGATMSRNQGPSKVPDGRTLFKRECAPCHGEGGRGGPGYQKPLTGDLSVTQLTAFIKSSMPPGPKKCPSRDAGFIAPYIFDAFYSPLAQERNRPARVELSRLTVRQFRNSVADLVSRFHSAIPDGAVHGLRAEYFKGRSRDNGHRVLSRIDPEVNFDFGVGAPAKEGFDPHNFSISWQGSVLAPDTGEYRFSIHSRHSCQLWLNDSRYPVVDGEVRSANDEDPKGTVTLLGGRAYSLRMVFTKATQGIDGVNAKKSASIQDSYVTLKWQRPDHVEEPIPTQFLFSEPSPKTFVVTSPFPPDDRSEGYERGNSVSKEWDEATTAAALQTADYVSKNLAEVTGVGENDKDREKRLKSYCRDFLTRAFRRPLTDELVQLYIDKQFSIAPNLQVAMQRVIVLGLKSPRFLYRQTGGVNRDAYFVASQLSFGLWDTIPSPELEQAAAKGELSTPVQISDQANKMTEDNRAWSKLRQFLLLWLKVDEVPDIVKSLKHYPTFDANAASDLRTSLELFLKSAAWSPSSNYRDLMLSNETFLNGRLAKLYGVSLPAEAPFQEESLDPGERSGLITNPYLLARFAYLDGSSPIHRGVLIVRNLLGRTLSPPPSNFTPLAASSHPDLTTRERVALQTKPKFCNNCHGIINPLGFTLERFDAIGKLRDRDNGKEIDSTGKYRARDGKLITFSGAKDLALYLADSQDARGAFVEKLFLNVAKQPPLAYGPNTLSRLDQSFSQDQCSIRKLMVKMALATALPADKIVQRGAHTRPKAKGDM
jgi:hypothetical protein